MRAAFLLLLPIAACQLPRPADVPDVDATPAMFAIGGHVSSMWPDASVELQLDIDGATEKLVVNQNGAFQFQRHAPSGTSFDVTVTTPPSGHDCTVENAIGQVDSADVTSIVVDCRAVRDIRLSAATAWDFDPATFDVSVPVSLLAQTTSVTVDAPKATSILIDGSLTASGVASPVFALPSGKTTIAIAVTVDSVTRTYTLAIDRGAEPIRQYAYLKASNTGLNDLFGWVVAVSGNWIAVGAPGEDSDATQIDGDQTNDRGIDRGAVYLFERSGTTWTFRHYVKAWSAGESGFGTSLSFTADHLAVGTTSGQVFVFRFDDGALTSEAIVTAAKGGPLDGFGTSISLRGSLLLVGAPLEDSGAIDVNGDESDDSTTDSGAAYAFRESQPGVWTQEAFLKSHYAQANQRFGTSVFALDDGSEEVALVGAPFFDVSASNVDAGAITALYHFATGWANQNYAEACCAGGNPGSTFGGAIAATPSGSVVLGGTAAGGSAPSGVAALGEALPGTSGLLEFFTNVTPSLGAVTRGYGSSIGIANHLVAISDPHDADSGFGVDPPLDSLRTDSGAVYLFEITGTLPLTQRAYIKATNSRTNLEFGHSLAISDDTLAIGTPFEQSAATGVNGDDLDASIPGAGAVYVWH